jgi:DNA invertase Pin-like site-specific DNA recombinase
MIDKIHATHLERRAIVYLRQSTLKQVYEHRESTARQYALRQRACELGWPAEHVEIIDEDLGHSGASTDDRPGFQRLAEEVAHGRVGALFALEVSRLARSSADWHRLLDLCGLADVLIADEQAVYTPRDYNDRLLLGLKGTMSEAEQYWMRLRLQGGKLSKARRGDLYLSPPTGYVWDTATSRLQQDSDEQVRRAIALVFERFRLAGSAYAVMRYFCDHHLTLPIRDDATAELRWVPPRHSLVLGILHNPTYAGAYVFGRHEQRRALVDGKIRRQRMTHRTPESWQICLRDHHPAYLCWEEYMANQRQIHSNCTHPQTPDQRGAAREGCALLQGLALCGRCGHRMTVRYHGLPPRPHYECRSQTRAAGAPCWTVSGQVLDDAVADLFLRALQPAEIELGLAVSRQVEQQAATLDHQWALRRERAQYDLRLAERRYKAVDPDNRVVARTLEREWNERLHEVEELEREYSELRQRHKMILSDEDRKRIRSLSHHLPRVWHANTTTFAERKSLLRMLLREVTLTPIDVPERQTRVQVLWQTGAVSELRLPRCSNRTARATPVSAVTRIREGVKAGQRDPEIAIELNRLGLRTGAHRPWDAKAVAWVRGLYHLQRPGIPPSNVRLPDRRSDGLYSVHGVAHRLGVTDHIVHYWIQNNWLCGIEGGPGHPWWFRLDKATVQRLKTLKAHGYGPKAQRQFRSRTKRKGHYA